MSEVGQSCSLSDSVDLRAQSVNLSEILCYWQRVAGCERRAFGDIQRRSLALLRTPASIVPKLDIKMVLFHHVCGTRRAKHTSARRRPEIAFFLARE